MVDYKKMYFNLAARVADVIEMLEEAQQAGEDAYVSAADKPPIKLAAQGKKCEEKE